MTAEQVAPFDETAQLAEAVCALAADAGLPHDHAVVAMTAIMNRLIVNPNSVFPTPPEYVRQVNGEPATRPPLTSSTHAFFDVVKARASRRDFGADPLDLSRLHSLLTWTMGKRAETIAYDWRGAPQRYVPSAGGLSSIDAYVIANQVSGLAAGSYYFDHRLGLIGISQGYMAQKVADMMPGQEWLARASAVLVFVGNTGRVIHKYDAMGFKLMMLDAGIAAGHAELVATALELRSTVLGGLPADRVAPLLRIDNANRVPLVTVAVGTRSGHG